MVNRVATAVILGLLIVPVAGYAADKKADAVQSAAPDVNKFDEQLAQAQKNMQKMQEQMAEIQKTQDPQRRQQLIQDHWTSMQDMMASMHNMWGPGMMGCCMGGNMGMMGGPMMGNMGMMGGPMMGGTGMMGWSNGMGNYYSKLTPEQIKQRQYMMDQYMGMQQNMMNHMMMHQYWTTTPPHP